MPKTDRDPVAWSLIGSSRPLNEFGDQKAGSRYYTRVDVWLGSQIKLEELRIPAHVEVLSGGEIEKFIAERQGQQKEVALRFCRVAAWRSEPEF